jgi:hypothetical protein
MASQTQPSSPPGYAEALGSPVPPLSPQPAASQFSTFSGYGLPGVTVAPPIQPTPVLPAIQQPAPTATGNLPRPNHFHNEAALGAGPTAAIEVQPVGPGPMAYEERDRDAEKLEKKERRKQQCYQFCEGCGKLTCASIVLTWAATLAACQLAICCMDSMSDSYYYY